jgi:sarcosine oxidase
MGSAAAWQLARRGRRVLGLDPYAPPHALGSSHGDSRITRRAIGEGREYVPLALRSYELWRELEAATGERLLAVTGGLIIAGPRSRSSHHGRTDFWNTTLATAREFDIAHEVLTTAELRKRFPQFRLAGDESGYYEPGAGVLHPERCVAAQLALAERHGAELHRYEALLDFATATANDGVTIRTDAGHYTAGTLILAAGPWLARFLGAEYARVFRVHRQVMYWFAPREEYADFLPGRFPVFIWHFADGSGAYVYGIPALDGSAGGVKVATGQLETTTSPDQVERTVSEAEARQFYTTHVAGQLPGLDQRCLRAATCLYTATPDGRFVIDRHPRYPNVLIVSACSGHGFKHSAAIGEAVAEWATDGRPRVDLAPFALGRLTAGTNATR